MKHTAPASSSWQTTYGPSCRSTLKVYKDSFNQWTAMAHHILLQCNQQLTMSPGLQNQQHRLSQDQHASWWLERSIWAPLQITLRRVSPESHCLMSDLQLDVDEDCTCIAFGLASRIPRHEGRCPGACAEGCCPLLARAALPAEQVRSCQFMSRLLVLCKWQIKHWHCWVSLWTSCCERLISCVCIIFYAGRPQRDCRACCPRCTWA